MRKNIILYGIGTIAVIAGAYLKINHTPHASYLIIIGLVFEVTAVIGTVKYFWNK